MDDDSLLSRLLGEDDHELPDWAGVDAPFGWPQPFVAAEGMGGAGVAAVDASL